MALDLEIIIEQSAISTSSAWKLITNTHTEYLSSFKIFKLFGKKASYSKMQTVIDKFKKPYFYIEFGNNAIHYSPLGNYELSFIMIENCVENLDDAEKWASPIITHKSFIHGRIYDGDYNLWQNASDPRQFTSKGKSVDGLTLYKDDLLNHVFVNTSYNPGRSEIRKGYIEALGHVMWFSDKFWETTGKKIDDLRNNVPCEIMAVNDRVHRVKFQDKPFTESKGPEAELQNQIRKMLFPALNKT